MYSLYNDLLDMGMGRTHAHYVCMYAFLHYADLNGITEWTICWIHKNKWSGISEPLQIPIESYCILAACAHDYDYETFLSQ